MTGVVAPLARPVAMCTRWRCAAAAKSSVVGSQAGASLPDEGARAGVKALAACDFCVGVGVREREALPFTNSSSPPSALPCDSASLVSSAASAASLAMGAAVGVAGCSGSGTSSLIGELTRLALPGARTTSSVFKTADGALAVPAAALQPDELGVTWPLPGALPVGELGAEGDDDVGGRVGCCCLEGMRVGILR